jgi:glycine oxidase
LVFRILRLNKSMTNKVVDYIIVGQGLAGSCLAVQLLKKKKKLTVIDFPDEHAASRVAAGLFNPVTGKKLSLTWMAEALFPYLHTFYRDAERLTNEQFYFPMPVYRPFVSAGEQNEWVSKGTDAIYTTYLENVFTSPVFASQVSNPYGGVLLKQCGYLDTTRFLKAIRRLIGEYCSLREELFNEAELAVHPGGVVYGDVSASQIIFCGGISVNQSNLFSWLPIRPLKGEALQVSTDEIVPRIYNRGVYVVPGVWKVGATYNHRDSVPGVTPAALSELTDGLNSLIRFPYQVRNQLWGFRPTVPDRRPILGPHPEFKNVVIFNGLGTKGVSLAPYFSNVLMQWLENGQLLNNEVDIQRYKSLYWKSA